MTYTPEQIEAAKQAMGVWAGACNGAGIAKALSRVYEAWLKDGTDHTNKCAPAMVMLYQLVHLAGGTAALESGIIDCVKECRMIVDSALPRKEVGNE